MQFLHVLSSSHLYLKYLTAMSSLVHPYTLFCSLILSSFFPFFPLFLQSSESQLSSCILGEDFPVSNIELRALSWFFHIKPSIVSIA